MQQEKVLDAPRNEEYPPSIPYIIANEAAERFSFYGMRSILPTFLIAQFFNPSLNPAMKQMAEAQANEATHFFVSLAYATPFIGALLADWFFGKYKVILYVSVVYCVGHLLLALFDTDLDMFRLGLLLIAAGAGGIKSCTSANVGDQFDKTNEHLLSKIYGWFYFTINSGSVLATLLIPIVYDRYGASVAFGVPGVLMAIATVIFFLGRKRYVRVPPTGINRNNFVFISVYALFNIGKRKKGQPILDVAKTAFDPKKVDDIKAVWRVLSVFIFVPVFWALWDQNLSEWVLQARNLDRTFFGKELLPEQIQTVNPIFLLAFIPVFTYLVFPLCEKIGIKPTPLRRIGAGLVLTAVSFVIIALLQAQIDAGARPHVGWQMLAYIILSASEALISVTTLEYAYTQSPPSMKSTMSALYLLTISLGNLFTGMINSNISRGGYFTRFAGADYYWLFIGIIAVNTVLYFLISPHIKEHTYLAGDAALQTDDVTFGVISEDEHKKS
ncbi:MAG: POT family MFS transporter [Mucilaginibacter polytrichastri]|nr:POT family MFS transporter [Mucilaginibacter polytrichastri]